MSSVRVLGRRGVHRHAVAIGGHIGTARSFVLGCAAGAVEHTAVIQIALGHAVACGTGHELCWGNAERGRRAGDGGLVVGHRVRRIQRHVPAVGQFVAVTQAVTHRAVPSARGGLVQRQSRGRRGVHRHAVGIGGHIGTARSFVLGCAAGAVEHTAVIQIALGHTVTCGTGHELCWGNAERGRRAGE